MARVEVFVRPVLAPDTVADAPAPQGRPRGSHPNGDQVLFQQATSPSGLKSHPGYGDEIDQFGSENLSGAHRPVRITIQNRAQRFPGLYAPRGGASGVPAASRITSGIATTISSDRHFAST